MCGRCHKPGDVQHDCLTGSGVVFPGSKDHTGVDGAVYAQNRTAVQLDLLRPVSAKQRKTRMFFVFKNDRSLRSVLHAGADCVRYRDEPGQCVQLPAELCCLGAATPGIPMHSYTRSSRPAKSFRRERISLRTLLLGLKVVGENSSKREHRCYLSSGQGILGR